MSSYGEKRDRQDERMTRDLKAMQDGIQKSGGSGRSGPANKKKNAMICLGFLIFLIIAIVAIVAVNL